MAVRTCFVRHGPMSARVHTTTSSASACCHQGAGDAENPGDTREHLPFRLELLDSLQAIHVFLGIQSSATGLHAAVNMECHEPSRDQRKRLFLESSPHRYQTVLDSGIFFGVFLNLQ